MDKVSFIIPARAERIEYLEKTIKSIEENVRGEYEIIIGYDGPPREEGQYLDNRPNLKAIKFPEVVGIKTNINALAAMATGKYLFKLDAHCSVGEGIDEILKRDIQDDWIVMPRFYILRRETWEWQDDRHYDYFFLCCPFTDSRGFRFKAGGHWPQRTAERENDHSFDIDETPQIHGSGWFMNKDLFFRLGGFPVTDPYGHAQEPLWLALKNWLMGGKVMVNKRTWHAHLHQETRDKGFALGHSNEERTYNLVATYWMNNGLEGRKYDIEWFIDKFMPMPTWPDNWRDLLRAWRESQNE
jgi:glycosyltransferase involved in cell wall biosynthesis